MKIVFLSNYFNHHQKPISDELYQLAKGEYTFVEMSSMPEFRKQLGYRELDASYVVKYSLANADEIAKLVLEADVVIVGHCNPDLLKDRIKNGGLVFSCSERLFKSFKNYLKSPVYRYDSRKLKGAYLLCCSAYAARDYNALGCFVNRCYKWGYFPEVKEYESIDTLLANKSRDLNGQNKIKYISILWVSRFIGWKHPEAPIFVAKKLKKEGYSFVLNMIGTGPLYQKYQRLIEKENLTDCVHLLGSMSPQEVRTHMEKSNIFLFTSDRKEGWGAVLNESMNSACAVVASHAIGSVPYLISDGKNGLIFKSGDWDDLYKKVKKLVDNGNLRYSIGKSAYNTITKTWCAKTASKRLVDLSVALLSGEDKIEFEGPCSKA